MYFSVNYVSLYVDEINGNPSVCFPPVRLSSTIFCCCAPKFQYHYALVLRSKVGRRTPWQQRCYYGLPPPRSRNVRTLNRAVKLSRFRLYNRYIIRRCLSTVSFYFRIMLFKSYSIQRWLSGLNGWSGEFIYRSLMSLVSWPRKCLLIGWQPPAMRQGVLEESSS